MPLIATRGAASAQGFGEFAQSVPVNYIEDVFSTWLYTGTGANQTITNGIDLSTKGGLVWLKKRGAGTGNHQLYDTVRGATNVIYSDLTNAQASNSTGLTSFSSNGFSIGTSSVINGNGDTQVAWTFREQPKFFDIVTYTGNGSNRTISHNLGSTPGCIIVKRTDGVTGWPVYHTSIGASQALELQGNFAAFASSSYWNNTAPTSTVFTVGTDSYVNANGGTYVAYLFAHNAGGFGLTGSDNVITCGSYTTDGSGNATVSLGYEPQWLLTKLSSTTGDWRIIDIMRQMSLTNNFFLYPNTSGAEVDNTFATWRPTATGFTHNQANANQTFIYIAIRRGPMKTPTTGTSVFSPLLTTNSTGATNTTGFPVDLQLWTLTGGYQTTAQDRLRGVSTTSTQTSCPELLVPYTNAESSNAFQVRNWNNTGFETPSAVSGSSTIWWNFRRAPGFFDEVCYTGDAAATNNQNHNLGVTPEMLIFKSRNNADNWAVFFPVQDTFTRLNSTSGKLNGSSLPSAVTSTTFNVGNTTGYSSVASVNISGYTYVTYLFASVAGVSKVGSYTGTGALQTVNCGFTGGARFVLIKRTDSTGDWWVYDSARGISSGNDPYILINVPGVAQVTGTNYVDTTSVGFQVTAAAPAGLNANGGTYIFLAIA